jgi:hypothetical protein
VSETIKISGDTFEVTLSGRSDAGEWKMVDAGDQLIAVVPVAVGEERLQEVMGDEYKEHEWGSYYARGNDGYCIVLRGHTTAEFEAILNTM